MQKSIKVTRKQPSRLDEVKAKAQSDDNIIDNLAHSSLMNQSEPSKHKTDDAPPSEDTVTMVHKTVRINQSAQTTNELMI